MILVRRETTPDDYHGMIRSQGVLTSAGGTNSHAAVVARGEGIPAVCGADGIRVDRQGRKFTAGGTTVNEGDWVTIDGFTGKVYAGQLELADSPIERARSGDPEARKEKIWQAYERFMARADAVRRLKVRANADTPGQSANAIERGAEGIGLCRTEHMFLGEERVAAVRTDDLRRLRRGGAGRLRHPAAAPARRLRRDLPGHGRQAGHRAAARPAAA